MGSLSLCVVVGVWKRVDYQFSLLGDVFLKDRNNCFLAPWVVPNILFMVENLQKYCL